MAYVIAVVALILLVGLVVVALRRRSSDGAALSEPSDGATDPSPAQRPEPEPMTGLESALAQVTDRDGRSLREHLDAETGHVDELRVPDDTGPLLRRALDHVEHPRDGEPHDDVPG